MAKALKTIPIKKYGISINKNTLISPDDLEDFLILFPDEEIDYIEALSLENEDYLLGTNGVTVAVSEINKGNISILMNENSDFFDTYLEKERKKRLKRTSPVEPISPTSI